MRTLIVLALLSLALAVDAKVYTWTDDKGVVHYTDRPTGPVEATVVEGVEEEPKPDPLEAPVKISQAALQGTWCQFQVSGDRAGSDAEAVRIEWSFRGDTLSYRNRKDGQAIESGFRVEGSRIVSDKSAMGDHTVLRFNDDSMEMSGESIYLRLRRGGC